MRYPLALLLACVPLPAAAQSFSGPATAIDGDTLSMAGERIRLFGIDAPESAQTCDRKGAAWACGSDAKVLLAQMVSGRTVECAQRDRDHYGRIVAACRVGQRDLGGAMVAEGYAIALRSFSHDYVDMEARAKSFGMALWGSTFQTPADYRAANPAQFRASTPRSGARMTMARASASAPPAAGATFSFRNCAAARAAGATPLYRGKPGYGAHMDGDGDGVACEPYRGG